MPNTNAIAWIVLLQGVALAMIGVGAAWWKDTRDHERQDQVAAQAAQAASLLLSSQNKIATVLASSDERIAAQLKLIHSLVNSDMTSARTSERDQTQLALLQLKRVVALSAKLGMPVSASDADAMKIAEDRVAELNAVLADRLSAQMIVDAENEAKL